MWVYMDIQTNSPSIYDVRETHKPVCRVIRSETELSSVCGFVKGYNSDLYAVDCDSCRNAYYCSKPNCPKYKTWETIIHSSNQDKSQAHAHFSKIQTLCNQPKRQDQATWRDEINWFASFSKSNKAAFTYEEEWLVEAFRFALGHFMVQTWGNWNGSVPKQIDRDSIEAPVLTLKPDIIFDQFVDKMDETKNDIVHLQKLAQQILHSVGYRLNINYEATVTPEMVMKLVRFIQKTTNTNGIGAKPDNGRTVYPPPTYHTYLAKGRARLLLQDA